MIRLSGVLCLLLTCAGTGMYAGIQVKKQVRQYQLLLSFLNDCEIYIRYQNLPLQELFSLLAENPDYRQLAFLNEIRTGEGSPHMRWQKAVQHLSGEARTIFQNLGHAIGQTDLQGQIAVLELSQIQMQSAYENCRTASEKKRKLYQSLGWLGGAMLAVLFL